VVKFVREVVGLEAKDPLIMFRAAPSRAFLGSMPTRLVLSVCGLLALVLALGVLAGTKYAAHLLTDASTPRGETSWADLEIVLGFVVLLAAVGILGLTTVQNYLSVTRTFERSKTLMRNILDSIPTGVLTIDSHAAVTALNGAAERLLGLPRSTAVGRPVADLLQVVPELVEWVRPALAGDRRTHEADVSVARAGGQRVTLRVSASDLKSDRGQPEGLVVLLRDVTEMNRLELQLRRADKLAALGTLAAGVAHEVKNPLHALSLNLHLLGQELAARRQSDAEIADYLDILRSEIQRIHRIVENFLRFSRPPIPDTKPTDLNATVERVLSLVAFEAADRSLTIKAELDPGLGPIPGDEEQLSQVFLNVAINALQAMQSGGTLTVRTRLDGDLAELLFKDTGEGIHPNHLPHLFDPYFTTRPSGVGLGLAIAHRIVEGHHGTIDVDSAPGTGTVVIVRLPAADPASKAREEP
jgi:PAS domain S-box-containing protein